MKTYQKVFIATSIDGYIADKNGNIDFLQMIPNPDQNDMGYEKFMNSVDAILMGRKTFETILDFDIPWPYQKKVFVLSNTLDNLDNFTMNQVEIVNGSLKNILNYIAKQGYMTLYIDGGKTIQTFLEEDLINEMIITIIPVVLGGGIPLFGSLSKTLPFSCKKTELFLDSIVQNSFERNK